MGFHWIIRRNGNLLGVIAFGGPAVHVAMLRNEAVRRREWLEEDEFLELFGAVTQ